MPSHDPDQNKSVKRQADQTLAQKVKVLQERVRKMGIVSGGSDDKAFMDEAWGDDSRDVESRDAEAPHTAIQTVLRAGT